MAEVAVVTVVRGRHDNLREQMQHLQADAPDALHVIVAMDDPEIAGLVPTEHNATVLDVPIIDGKLPLALARNHGVTEAIRQGAELVVLLDVDCLPAPGAVDAYLQAASLRPGTLLSGPVTYLPEGVRQLAPADLIRWHAPHDARPAPGPGELLGDGNHDLFWSLNAAFTPATWQCIGGFHEGYVGYGAEDTDFGWTARARGVELVWVGGAEAYHLYHPVSRPPVEHIADIVRNALVAQRRWDRLPMKGWLDAFADMGLVTWVDGLPQLAAEPPSSVK
ncbi:glycosyltransferase family 2 protein [Yimella sp. cx-573]|nr:glycosyltransferase family 2 protein [Yimella sp. cx-573]